MIIKCNKVFLMQRCLERGYSIEEVEGCIISKNGNQWEIDTEHINYPSKNKHINISSEKKSINRSGPGTELKKLLSKIGISADVGCKCRKRAIYMDHAEIKEPGWCEKNIDTIVGWLEEEAKKRGLPFIKTIARMIVKRAIKNSKQS